jgi:hypothetical protein
LTKFFGQPTLINLVPSSIWRFVLAKDEAFFDKKLKDEQAAFKDLPYSFK